MMDSTCILRNGFVMWGKPCKLLFVLCYNSPVSNFILHETIPQLQPPIHTNTLLTRTNTSWLFAIKVRFQIQISTGKLCGDARVCHVVGAYRHQAVCCKKMVPSFRCCGQINKSFARNYSQS